MSLKLKLFLSAIALAVIAAIVAVWSSEQNDPQQTVMSILGNAPQNFLATTRSEQLSVSTVDDGGWLLGSRQGVATIQVRSHSGIDLKKVHPEDITVDGSHVRVRLPDPEVLAVEPDLSTYRSVTKASGLHHVIDAVRSSPVREELFQRTKDAIPAYRDPANYPDREEIVDQLNKESPRLFAPSGLEVQFE